MCRLKTVLCITTLFTFSALPAFSQSSDNTIVPGLIQVKFRMESLKKISKDIVLDDIKNKEIRKILKSFKFAKGRKVFPDFMPEDTNAVSLSGKQIKLKNLSNWYVLNVLYCQGVYTLG